MKAKEVLFTLIALAVVGCSASRPPATADYGSYPDGHVEIVKRYFNAVLVDPYSAHYRFLDGPTQGCALIGPWPFDHSECGYWVRVGVNAKNRMGGYTGEEIENLLIRNGRVHAQEYYGGDSTIPGPRAKLVDDYE